MELNNLEIHQSKRSDLEYVLEVERQAFQSEEESQLVYDLLLDKSAVPLISLLAFVKDEAVGHILFTRSTISGQEESVLSYILAPLAVKPQFQSKGVGGALIHEGIHLLTQLNTQLVFVLGHKEYYPKFGFLPDAESLGFPAPYPIPKEDADAWMVKPLTEHSLDNYKGKVNCADAMNKPEYWRE